MSTKKTIKPIYDAEYVNGFVDDMGPSLLDTTLLEMTALEYLGKKFEEAHQLIEKANSLINVIKWVIEETDKHPIFYKTQVRYIRNKLNSALNDWERY